MKLSWSGAFRLIFTGILTVLGVLFFTRTGKTELLNAYHTVQHANYVYLFIALIFTGLLVIAQAYMMQLCYRSLAHLVPLKRCVVLYLKRFFLSPFIPGGFSVAQYMLNHDLKQYAIPVSENAFISTIYVLGAFCSYVIILVPTFLYAVFTGTLKDTYLFTVLNVLAIVVTAAALGIFLFRKPLLEKVRATLHPYIGHFHLEPIITSIFVSVGVDTIGMITLWLSLRSLGLPSNFEIAALGYIVTILIVTISPLFSGLVVVEGALVYTLSKFGIPVGEGTATTLVFRTFQLWIPTLVGGVLYALPHLAKWTRIHHLNYFER